jgi:predicted component of viral defense system (DUF524 family)
VISVTIAPSVSDRDINVIDEAEASEKGEASVQLSEGCSYEYLIDEGFILEEIPGIVSQSKLNKQSGRITPNIYVGTLPVNILDATSFERVGILQLEVRSVKTSYREDYRRMLAEIAEKCTDLLMQHSSPVVQTFKVDPEKDSVTAYQRFAFIKSVLDSEEFESAVQKIITAPTTKWRSILTDKPIQSVRRINRRIVRQLSSSNQRINIQKDHPLGYLVDSIPERIHVSAKEETADTAENRFIKFALEVFLKQCSDFTKIKSDTRLRKEAIILTEKLERFLDASLFKEVSVLSSLPLNSPVLQRKEGYREIFRFWILFDLAAKLTWSGGEDVYGANKKDVAVLYEYWLFFKLIEIVCEVFEIKPPQTKDLLDETSDGFGLKLRQGVFLPIKGVSDNGTRKLWVQLSYNRVYSGDQHYPKAGSWSRNLRPDYTLSIWPYKLNDDEAEKEELIVHIHFDAKYKVEKFQEIFSDKVQLDEEKEEERKGTYKKADLLKMHAYRDAIRRTAGAYILYPGNDQTHIKKGFHEIVPGLGAFSIRPSRIDNGVAELKKFLIDIANHLHNRASQREKIALQTFKIYENKNRVDLNEPLPETFGPNRGLIPDETFVLVGYSTTKERFKWFEEQKKYVFRMGHDQGSLELNDEVVNAKYLLIRKKGLDEASDLFKIKSKGPKVYSRSDLQQIGYPFSDKPKEFYLLIEIERVTDKEFQNVSWKFKELEKYKRIIESEKNLYSKAGLPFTVTLTDLMMTKKK